MRYAWVYFQLNHRRNPISKSIASLRTALANRRAYNRSLDEIAKIDARELADLNVDRDTLIAGAYREVYGVAR